MELNTSGKVLLGFKWLWERNDATDALLSVRREEEEEEFFNHYKNDLERHAHTPMHCSR